MYRSSYCSTVAHSNNQGFSLPELLVVLLIVAFLTAMAAPSFQRTLSAQRLALGSGALLRSLSLTRSEAIKRNTRVVMCRSRTAQACETASGWESGWVVFQDTNNDAQLDAGEAIVYRQPALAEGVVLFTNGPLANFISYNALGTARHPSGALQMGTFTLCEKSASPVMAQDIVIGSVGRPRLAKRQLPACPSPS
jgi:type IV fimbrial biogenesis protein FimT